MNPLVSVIIPCYNAERYIAQTLESVLAQTYNPIEIIVVNDGSTDHSYEVAASFADHGVIVCQQKNSGAAAARNKGFSLCHGEYIQFFDADDLMNPDKIRLQMEELLHSPDGTVATCSWKRFKQTINDGKSEPMSVFKDYKSPIQLVIDRLSLDTGYIIGPCFLVPRKLIEFSGGWDETLSLNDDGEFFMRITLLCREIHFVTDSWVFYRSTDKTSVSAIKGQKGADSIYRSLCNYQKKMLAVENSAQVKQALVKAYSYAAWDICVWYPPLIPQILKKIKELGYPFFCSSNSPEKYLLPFIGIRLTLYFRTYFRKTQSLLKTYGERKNAKSVFRRT